MGFVVLLAIAVVLGWLASIVLREDLGLAIAANVIVAALGALIFASLVGGEAMDAGISAHALLAGTAGAVLFIAAFVFTRLRLAR